jgi:hypothetical protein
MDQGLKYITTKFEITKDGKIPYYEGIIIGLPKQEIDKNLKENEVENRKNWKLMTTLALQNYLVYVRTKVQSLNKEAMKIREDHDIFFDSIKPYMTSDDQDILEESEDEDWDEGLPRLDSHQQIKVVRYFILKRKRQSNMERICQIREEILRRKIYKLNQEINKRRIEMGIPIFFKKYKQDEKIGKNKKLIGKLIKQIKKKAKRFEDHGNQYFEYEELIRESIDSINE